LGYYWDIIGSVPDIVVYRDRHCSESVISKFSHSAECVSSVPANFMLRRRQLRRYFSLPIELTELVLQSQLSLSCANCFEDVHLGHSAHRAAAALRRLRSQKWLFHLLLEILVLVLVLGVLEYCIFMLFFLPMEISEQRHVWIPVMVFANWAWSHTCQKISDDQQQTTQHRLYRITFLAFRCCSVCDACNS
jgi:hypothetical protein